MATMANARKKWEDKTKASGQIWQTEVQDPGAEQRYATNLQAFAGVPVGPQTRAMWKSGVVAAGAAKYTAGVSAPGLVDKWERKFKAGISR